MNDTIFETLQNEGIKIQRVGLDDIYDAAADLFAPNAIGGTLTDENIQRLHNAGVKIVCGAANNQQQDQAGGTQSHLMHDLGILYCPDYIVNAGGVIWVAKVGEDAKLISEDIRTGVPKRFEDVVKLQEEYPDQDMASLASLYSKRRVQKAQDQNDDTRKAG